MLAFLYVYVLYDLRGVEKKLNPLLPEPKLRLHYCTRRVVRWLYQLEYLLITAVGVLIFLFGISPLSSTFLWWIAFSVLIALGFVILWQTESKYSIARNFLEEKIARAQDQQEKFSALKATIQAFKGRGS